MIPTILHRIIASLAVIATFASITPSLEAAAQSLPSGQAAASLKPAIGGGGGGVGAAWLWSPGDPKRSNLVAQKPPYVGQFDVFFQHGVVPDGVGGWYSVWGEYVNYGGETIRVQRLGPSGNKLWGLYGQPIAEPPAVVPGNSGALAYPDGSGGLLVIYGGIHGYVDGQRFDRNGSRLWGPTGKNLIPLEWGAIAASVAVIEREPDGGFYLPYTRQVGPNLEIYLVRFDAGGSLVWPGMGKHVTTISGNGQLTSLLTLRRADGGLYIAMGINDTALAAQRLDPNGEKLWGPAGLYISDVPGDQFLFNGGMVHDGAGGFMLVWQQRDAITFEAAYFGLRLDENANHLWTPTSKQLTPWGCYPGTGLSDGTGGLWAFVQSGGSDGWGDVSVTRIDNDGTLAFPITPVCTAKFRQRAMHAVLADPDHPETSDLWMVWPDGRQGASPAFDDIYYQRVGRDGTLRLPVFNGVPLTTEFAIQADQYQLRIASTSQHGLFVTWNEFANDWRLLRCERVPK